MALTIGNTFYKQNAFNVSFRFTPSRRKKCKITPSLTFRDIIHVDNSADEQMERELLRKAEIQEDFLRKMNRENVKMEEEEEEEYRDEQGLKGHTRKGHTRKGHSPSLDIDPDRDGLNMDFLLRKWFLTLMRRGGKKLIWRFDVSQTFFSYRNAWTPAPFPANKLKQGLNPQIIGQVLAEYNDIMIDPKNWN